MSRHSLSTSDLRLLGLPEGYGLVAIGNGHCGIVKPDGTPLRLPNGVPVQVPTTGSNPRTLKNVRSRVRRALDAEV